MTTAVDNISDKSDMITPSYESSAQELSNTFDIFLGSSLLLGTSLYRLLRIPFRTVSLQLALGNEYYLYKDEWIKSKYYNGHYEGIKRIYKEEGLKGFFKGYTIKISKRFFDYLIRTTTLISLDVRREYFLAEKGDISHRSVFSYQLIYFGTKCFVDLFTYPFTTVFIRNQDPIHHPLNRGYNGPFDIIKRMLKEEGFLSFYKGWLIKQLARILRFTSLAYTYSLFGSIFEYFGLRGFQGDHHSLVVEGITIVDQDEVFDSIQILLGTLVSRFLTYPLKLLRKRMQNGNQKRLRDLIKSIYQEEGMKGFYSGSLYSYLIPSFNNTTN
ncbi:hypothetical protein ABK040_011669 [Willaertia magna]